MHREYDVPVVVGNPSVNYRETIAEKISFNYLHKKQSGGAGQYARVVGYMEPSYTDLNDPKTDLSCQFQNQTQGMNIPNEYIPAIEKAFHEATKRGPLTGYPVIGVRYVLKDGQTHAVDSSSMAFMIATKYSFAEAYKNGTPVILEPLMAVEVAVPTEYQGSIMGSLVKRRGNVTDTKSTSDLFIVNADVPLQTMFGYATELRGAT